MKRNRLTIIVLLAIIYTFSITLITNAAVHANPVIIRLNAQLNASKSATFSVVTEVICNQLGTVSYKLHKSNGTLIKSETINDFGSGINHYSKVDLSSYINNGDSYYITACFSADGETGSVTSGVRSY